MDYTSIIFVIVLVVLILFMFRNSRKRQRTLADLQQKMVPGAQVMTSFGMYGTLLSLDEDTNIAEVETTPGTVLRIHRQTISRVVDDDLPDDEDIETPATAQLNEDHAIPIGDPEYGERLGSDDKKSASRAAKKSDD